MTGYCLQKWVDNDYTGDVYSSGVDAPIIRYAEVLLSYLECKINAGDAIDQNLLDLTIIVLRLRIKRHILLTPKKANPCHIIQFCLP